MGISWLYGWYGSGFEGLMKVGREVAGEGGLSVSRLFKAAGGVPEVPASREDVWGNCGEPVQFRI